MISNHETPSGSLSSPSSRPAILPGFAYLQSEPTIISEDSGYL